MDGRERVGVGATGSAWFVALVGAGGLVLGLVLGWAGGWLADQSWLPAQGLVDRVVDLADGAPWWSRAGVGLVVGLVAGALLLTRATVVEIDPREIRVVGGRAPERASRAQVTSVVLEGRTLSLRGSDDADLVVAKVDSDLAHLRTALERHAWPLRP